MNNTLEELKKLLEMQGVEGEGQIVARFKKLAEILLKDIKIQKGDKKYLLTDIEFYWYTNTHRDIITYPRKCSAGMWYFHSSGVDISFESDVLTEGDNKPILNKDARFGGILIRGIKPEESGQSEKKDALSSHPLNIVDELFDCIDAFGNPDDLPKLIAEPHAAVIQKAEKRYIPLRKDTPETKVKKIIANYKKGCITDEFQKELIDSFSQYKEQPYRYKAEVL